VTQLRGIFVLVPITGPLGERIAKIQRLHDPRLAKFWAPHLTLLGSSGVGPILPNSAPEQLRQALAPVVADTAPLTLAFKAPERFTGRDIVVLPLDPHGPLRQFHERLREALDQAGLQTYPARFPFTPHVTLTMYPPLTREREQRLLALRIEEPLVIDRLVVVLTQEPQAPRELLALPLGSGVASA
jgi:2'-5' RNA ligase